MNKHNCPTCHWNTHGHCHFNPPTTQLVMQQGIAGTAPQPVSYHPPVRPEGYCSKHSALSSALIDMETGLVQ